MKLTDVIKDGLMRVKLEWKLDTYKHYLNHAKHFLTWCDKSGIENLDQFTEEKLIDYISFNKLSCSNRTINIRIGNLRRLFRHAGINTQIFSKIPKMKEIKRTYNMLSLKQIKEIRNYAYSMNSDLLNNLLHQAVLLLLMETGVRRKELCLIEKDNVDINNRTILLTNTKTSQERLVMFKEKTVPIIKKLLELKTNHKYLLHNKLKNRPVNEEDIIYIVSHKTKNDLGYKSLHPHMFRHSLASIMIMNNASLNVVQELLGHENIQTTERYLHTTKKYVKNTYDLKFNLD